MPRHLYAVLSQVAIVMAFADSSSCGAARANQQQPSPGIGATLEQRTVGVITRIQRADYEGNRPELRRLLHELTPGGGNRQFSARVHYWRGFALWRRALNGFNEMADPEDLAADLEAAVREFEQSYALDGGFADARIGMLSCLQNLAFIHRHDSATLERLISRFVPMLKELSVTARDNPRFLWVYGASQWYALPGLSEAQIADRRAAALATYRTGLEHARRRQSAGPMEPSWGEPELLMNLAWSTLNAAPPDLAAAERHAAEALAIVPHWHYVRDILIPQIRQTKAQRRLDFFVGRWTARGQTFFEAVGAAAGDTTGVAVYRRTARDNWLFAEVTLDGMPPYGVSVLMAPTPDGTYVAVAANNLAPVALQFAGRWLDEQVLELETSESVAGRRQRVRYTRLSDAEMEFLVTESRDDGRTYHRHSVLTLTREK
jgi:hypothetical protein